MKNLKQNDKMNNGNFSRKESNTEFKYVRNGILL